MTPFGFFTLGLNMTRLGLDSQYVIAERMNRLARGDAAAGVETMRMITEKAMAAGEANARIVSAMMSGKPERASTELVAMYGRKVRANRKRLHKSR